MTIDVVLRGRGVYPGRAEGLALVSSMPISGFGGINPLTGTVTERRHELVGQSFKGRVLVFPGAKGSSGWASNFQATRLAGAAPMAMIFCKMSTKIALGVVVMRVPAVTELDGDPLRLIESGDYVCVDGDQGIVVIRRP